MTADLFLSVRNFSGQKIYVDNKHTHKQSSPNLLFGFMGCVAFARIAD